MTKRRFKHLNTVLIAANHVIPITKNNIIYKGNFKCHNNCLSYLRKHPKKVKAIVGGIQVFDDAYVAHFLIQLKDGSYIDPTYGNMSDLYSSFIPVKYYEEYFSPNVELINIKIYIYNLLPWYLKLFINHNEY